MAVRPQRHRRGVQGRWPDEESRIIFTSTVFTYTERITALTFLYGNLRNVEIVYAALLQQIGVDARDRDHATTRQVRPRVLLF